VARSQAAPQQRRQHRAIAQTFQSRHRLLRLVEGLIFAVRDQMSGRPVPHIEENTSRPGREEHPRMDFTVECATEFGSENAIA
jgi:hypothetical protein